MKILFISQLYPSSRDTLKASYNRNLMTALSAEHTVEVVSPVMYTPLLRLLRGPEFPAGRETLSGVDVRYPRVRYPAGILRSRHAGFYRSQVKTVLQDRISSLQPDVIIVGFLYPDAVACLPLCREAGNCPVMVRVNGSDFRVRREQAQFREQIMSVLHEADHVLCPGQALKTDLISEGIAAERITSFKNGVDSTAFDAPETESARSGILFVGNLVPGKRADVLIRAVASMNNQHEQNLTIVGDGPERSRLLRLTESMGLGDRVNFAGALDPDKVAGFMRKAACLCLPSASEGMPNVVVEALSCGTPVVATNVGEIPFLVEKEESGILIENTVERMVSRLAEALNDALGREWNHLRIAESVQGLTWESAAMTVSDALKQVVQEHGS